MGQLHSAFKQADLIKGLDVWGKACMHAKDLAFNNSCNTEVVKDVRAILPRVSIAVFSDSFIVKTIGGRDLSRFVVASEKSNSIWVLKLEAHKVLKCLERMIAAVDVISHEDVGSVGNLPALVEKLEEVIELAVDVAADGGRRTDGLHVAFLN
jgi:hypothetical protein